MTFLSSYYNVYVPTPEMWLSISLRLILNLTHHGVDLVHKVLWTRGELLIKHFKQFVLGIAGVECICYTLTVYYEMVIDQHLDEFCKICVSIVVFCFFLFHNYTVH